MPNTKWRLRQLHTNNIYDVSASNLAVGRCRTAQIALGSCKASRQHAALIIDIEGHLLLQDFKSVNGTFVNGSKIAIYNLHQVYAGDIISFGIQSDISIENDVDKEVFFEVLKETIQDSLNTTEEANIADSTTDMIEDSGRLKKTDFFKEASKESNSSVELPSSTEKKDDCIEVIEIDDSLDDDESPEAVFRHKNVFKDCKYDNKKESVSSQIIAKDSKKLLTKTGSSKNETKSTPKNVENKVDPTKGIKRLSFQKCGPSTLRQSRRHTIETTKHNVSKGPIIFISDEKDSKKKPNTFRRASVGGDLEKKSNEKLPKPNMSNENYNKVKKTASSSSQSHSDVIEVNKPTDDATKKISSRLNNKLCLKPSVKKEAIIILSDTSDSVVEGKVDSLESKPVNRNNDSKAKYSIPEDDLLLKLDRAISGALSPVENSNPLCEDKISKKSINEVNIKCNESPKKSVKRDESKEFSKKNNFAAMAQEKTDDQECFCVLPSTSTSPQIICPVHNKIRKKYEEDSASSKNMTPQEGQGLINNENKTHIKDVNCFKDPNSSLLKDKNVNFKESDTSFKDPNESLKNYKPSEKSFSTNKDYSIIIDLSSDDDDDTDLSCSQIFQMSEKVKTEVHDEKYQKIKNELAEMDFCEEEIIRNIVPINLENDFETGGFENTQDIWACLEDGAANKVTNDNGALANIISQEENDELLQILGEGNLELGSTIEQVELICNINEQKLKETNVSTNKDPEDFPENIVNDKKDLTSNISRMENNLSLNTSENIGCSDFTGKPKYTKPPIIEAHSIKTRRDSTKKSPLKKETKLQSKETVTGSKRKNSLEMLNQKKKIKASPKGEPPKCDTKSIQQEFKRRRSVSSEPDMDKSVRAGIKEERRKKLKELNDRDVSFKPKDQKEKNKTVKVLPESKTNRGSFLQEPPSKNLRPRPVTPTKRFVISENKEKQTPSKTYNLRRTKSFGDINEEIKKSSSSNEQPLNSNRCNLRALNVLDTNARHSIPINKQGSALKSLNIQDKIVKKPSVAPPQNLPLHQNGWNPAVQALKPNNFSSHQQYQGIPQMNANLISHNIRPQAVQGSYLSNNLMWSRNGQIKDRKQVVKRFPSYSIEDVLKVILHWLANWLVEQVASTLTPPLNNPPATKIPLHFKNFQQYYDTFHKLVILEMWEYLYKSFQDQQKGLRRVKIEHIRVADCFCYLDCVYYITQNELKNGMFLKSDDLVLFECKVKDLQNQYVSVNFGYVQKSKRSEISDNDVISISRNGGYVGHFCPGEPHTSVEFTVVIKHQEERKIQTNGFAIVQSIASITPTLKQIRAIKGVKDSKLCSKILHPKINEYKFPVIHGDVVQPHNLNDEQRTIVLEAASMCTGKNPGIYCIQGPPGTGKSSVIVELVFQILFSHLVTHKTEEPPMILLAAPSNTAVDSLLRKLMIKRSSLDPRKWDRYKRKVNVVRIGPESSMGSEAKFSSLKALSEKHVPLKNYDLPEFQAAASRNENLHEFAKKHFGSSYSQQVKLCEDIVLQKSNIICTTLNSCVSGKLIEAVNKGLIHFTCCIIDESTQCHEVESLLPTMFGIDKFVLVGDPKQLNATIMNREAANLGYGQSLLSRIFNNFLNDPRSPIRMLTEQYRMHPEICAFPNKHFYEGRLRSSPKHSNKIPENVKPYLVFNCNSSKSRDSNDYTNIDEVHLIQKLLTTLFAMINPTFKYTVGIITPYNAQKVLITKNVKELGLPNQNCKITVNTVDSFQGSEEDIVIISCVRDSTNSFLQNENRLNVALTRAKQALYIIGNYSLFKECRPLYDLREDAKRRKVLLDIKQDPLTIDNFEKYLIRRDR